MSEQGFQAREDAARYHALCAQLDRLIARWQNWPSYATSIAPEALESDLSFAARQAKVDCANELQAIRSAAPPKSRYTQP